MLSNVKKLLRRLDEHCVQTKELLLKEQERTFCLRQRIDSIAYKRIHSLPLAVQEGQYSKFVDFLLTILQPHNHNFVNGLVTEENTDW